MGGDLNLKKSWHPHLRKNQERVWKEERAALDDRKLIEKLRKEREEERQIEELQKLQEASGGKAVQKRVDWMYAGPGGDGAQVTEEREAYLLGKRRIDNLLKASDAETQGLRKGAAVGVEAIANGASAGVSASDTKKKVLEDPLLMIQKQKMEMQIKAAREAQKLEKNKERREKDKVRDRHHRRDRDRSRSPRRNHRDDREERRHHRRHRSRSPYRRRHSDSPARRERSRSRSPRRSHESSRRHRSRSPRRSDEHRRYRSKSPRRSNDYRRYRSRSPQRRSPAPVAQTPAGPTAAERLAAMQADASSLEQQRDERVRLREAEDAAEEAKHRNDRDGGHRFISKVRLGAGEGMELGDALLRGQSRTTVDV